MSSLRILIEIRDYFAFSKELRESTYAKDMVTAGNNIEISSTYLIDSRILNSKVESVLLVTSI
jgi:hypothetical protein